MVDKHDMVGKQLGDYLIKDKLATGGMSYVFIGEDVSLGRRAAVKVLTPDITEDDDSLPERFKREARAVAQLEHDNIIPIYQFGELDGVYFLAMRFIDGHDFADEINDAKRKGELMDVNRALDVLAQVASALDHAHANGIIHRDIKPSNVLIDNNSGKAILTDFGLVLWSNVDKTLGTAFGTPRYISPEQATDSQAAVPQSDVYSLAVIMYEIVTGKMLFTGQTPMEMAISHITEKPVPPRSHNPKIPIAVEQQILRSLDKEPINRHQSATEFITALREAYQQSSPELRSQSAINMDIRKASSQQPTKPLNMAADGWSLPSENADTSDEKPMTIDAPIPSAKPDDINDESNPSRLVVFGMTVIGVLLVVGLLSILSGRIGQQLPLPTIASTDGTNGAQTIAEVTDEPTATDEPLLEITNTATDIPTDEPTATDEPTITPTDEPTATDEPTVTPTDEPTATERPTDVPTAVPTERDEPTPYPILEELPEGVPVSLIYDMTLIAIRNDSEGAVIFNDMRLVGDMDDEQGIFDGSTLPTVALLPGECIVIRSERMPVPVEWECVRERSNVLLQTPVRFWFADSSDDTAFKVYWRNNEIKSCDTVGRAVARVNTTTCAVEWPIVADG